MEPLPHGVERCRQRRQCCRVGNHSYRLRQRRRRQHWRQGRQRQLPRRRGSDDPPASASCGSPSLRCVSPSRRPLFTMLGGPRPARAPSPSVEWALPRGRQVKVWLAECQANREAKPIDETDGTLMRSLSTHCNTSRDMRRWLIQKGEMKMSI
mmetsp:Transcript_25696/g.71634  ORF Transcript_25696/g.71634 Transcript_25696/m.71634 type:complete len:153 (+) Transcript_25696:645-1103(+)